MTERKYGNSWKADQAWNLFEKMKASGQHEEAEKAYAEYLVYARRAARNDDRREDRENKKKAKGA